MSELEAAAKPILLRFITGERSLTTKDDRTVRRWLAKTAVVCHFAEPNSDDPAAVDPADRALIMRGGVPPGWRFLLGTLDSTFAAPPAPRFRTLMYEAPLLRDKSRAMRCVRFLLIGPPILVADGSPHPSPTGQWPCTIRCDSSAYKGHEPSSSKSKMLRAPTTRNRRCIPPDRGKTAAIDRVAIEGGVHHHGSVRGTSSSM